MTASIVEQQRYAYFPYLLARLHAPADRRDQDRGASRAVQRAAPRNAGSTGSRPCLWRNSRAEPDHEAAWRGIEWIRKHYRRALAIGAAGLLNAFFRSPNASSDMLGFSNAIA